MEPTLQRVWDLRCGRALFAAGTQLSARSSGRKIDLTRSGPTLIGTPMIDSLKQQQPVKKRRKKKLKTRSAEASAKVPRRDRGRGDLVEAAHGPEHQLAVGKFHRGGAGRLLPLLGAGNTTVTRCQRSPDIVTSSGAFTK